MQFPVLRTAQSAFTLYFRGRPTQSNIISTSLGSIQLHLMREGCSYTYPPLSIVRYSFIQLSELEQCRVKKLAQGFNTAAQDSNPGSLSRESEALPLSHCALHYAYMNTNILHHMSRKINWIFNADNRYMHFSQNWGHDMVIILPKVVKSS